MDIFLIYENVLSELELMNYKKKLNSIRKLYLHEIQSSVLAVERSLLTSLSVKYDYSIVFFFLYKKSGQK